MIGGSTSAALIPGSFDPVTYGHLDVVGRAAACFDRVVVAVAPESSRKEPLFTVDDRLAMLVEVTDDLANVEVVVLEGLLATFAVRHGVRAVVKGLRAVSDFEYELQMAQLNLRLAGVETLFMPTTPDHSFLSSSLVREVARYGGDVSSMVPVSVARRLQARFAA